MRVTRANVEQFAKERGYEPTQIDGILGGFAWLEPDIIIGGKFVKGRIIKFKPLADWQDENAITYG